MLDKIKAFLEIESTPKTEETPHDIRTLEAMDHSNVELKKQLTKKNDQYVHQLEKQLRHYGASEARIVSELHHLLPELIESQKQGITAKHLYGTAGEYANTLVHGKQSKHVANGAERSPSWQLAIDGGLLLGGMFAMISGFTLLMNPQTAQGMGLLSLIINYILGGLMMMVLIKYAPNLDAPKGQRGIPQYIIASFITMGLWISFISVFQAAIPATINPTLPAVGYIIIAAASLAGKYFFKRHYNVTGGAF
ncbi:DUF1129 domain-containing protein [Atopobacter phocae]|uniref:DUF1129 domain-containing protein n=1 Tax=Atopobacter phocae TaxID=136492 RepID=UPI00047005D0|nr:DUF1129 family protein [Atopobacter phocae]